MQLLSTRFDGLGIELTYADNPDLDAATTVLRVRLPREAESNKSLAWHRYWALGDLQEIVRELRDADRDIVEKNS
jgi:hypothetical protein